MRLANGTVENIDFREVAPQAAYRGMYYGQPSASVNGMIAPDLIKGDCAKCRTGALAIAVPGELAGLEYVFKKYGSGKVTWKQLVQPAIELAMNGPVGPLLAKRIAVYILFSLSLSLSLSSLSLSLSLFLRCQFYFI